MIEFPLFRSFAFPIKFIDLFGYISNLFASKDTDKLSKVKHYKTENNIAVLDDTLGHLELSVFQQIDIADHVLVIGKVENLAINENKEPLIYYRSNYREIK